MSRWFGRRDKPADDQEFGLTGDDAAGSAVDAAAHGPAAAGSEGPYDAAADYPTGHRIDLGALRIPAVAGTSLQVEVDKATNVARSASVVAGPSRVTLTAFAAPRTAGVWDDIRSEIVTAVNTAGGTVIEREGGFGTEVISTVPTTLPDGRQAMRVQRFIGIDGPRWFLRAVFAGPEVVAAAGIATAAGAVDEKRTAALEDVVRGCVVARGTVARPPREQLPLTLPATAAPVEVPAADTDGTGNDGNGTDGSSGPAGPPPIL